MNRSHAGSVSHVRYMVYGLKYCLRIEKYLMAVFDTRSDHSNKRSTISLLRIASGSKTFFSWIKSSTGYFLRRRAFMFANLSAYSASEETSLWSGSSIWSHHDSNIIYYHTQAEERH